MSLDGLTRPAGGPVTGARMSDADQLVGMDLSPEMQHRPGQPRNASATGSRRSKRLYGIQPQSTEALYSAVNNVAAAQ